MELLDQATWDNYKATIHSGMDTFGKQPIVWRKYTAGISEHGETPTVTYTDITLTGLVAYNYFRSWPITQATSTGKLDKENMVIILDKQKLWEAGYLNTNGEFIYRPSEDRFIVNGQVYMDAGNTDVAQAAEEPLLLFIICKKEETSTGDRIYPET